MKDFRKTRRKRIEAWLTAAMFLFGTLTGCGSVSDTHGDVGTPNDGKLKVVTTLFPYYDFTRQIAGDAVDLSMVIPAGQDSHSFEPTPADIRLIQNADLLICNGGAMEQWVSQVVADNFDERIEQKIFHAEIVVDHTRISAEEKTYQKIPVINDFKDRNGNDIMMQQIQRNYDQIKADAQAIINEEMRRIKNDPELRKRLGLEDEKGKKPDKS